MATITTFFNQPQAQAVVCLLRSCGVQAQLRDEHVASLNWLYIPALGGIRLEVAEADRAEVESLLASYDDRDQSAQGDTFATERRSKRSRGLVALAIALFG